MDVAIDAADQSYTIGIVLEQIDQTSPKQGKNWTRNQKESAKKNRKKYYEKNRAVLITKATERARERRARASIPKLEEKLLRLRRERKIQN